MRLTSLSKTFDKLESISSWSEEMLLPSGKVIRTGGIFSTTCGWSINRERKSELSPFPKVLGTSYLASLLVYYCVYAISYGSVRGIELLSQHWLDWISPYRLQKRWQIHRLLHWTACYYFQENSRLSIFINANNVRWSLTLKMKMDFQAIQDLWLINLMFLKNLYRFNIKEKWRHLWI